MIKKYISFGSNLSNKLLVEVQLLTKIKLHNFVMRKSHIMFISPRILWYANSSKAVILMQFLLYVIWSKRLRSYFVLLT